jgi:outer membrane lipoprotein-sorting protein
MHVKSLAHAFAGVLAIASAAAMASAQSPTVDEIVAKNLAAKGGADKLRAVTSVKTKGRIKTGRGDLPVVVWTMRPNLMRRELTADGQTQVVAFDGKMLWGINPMLGGKPQEITGPAAERTRQDADDFDSVLLDYAQKGYKVELLPAEGAGTRLRVTKKNGTVQEIHLAPDTFLEDRISMEVDQGGRKGVLATEFSNYKPVNGMMVPFTIRQSLNGQVSAEVQYEQVEFNLPIDEALFRMKGSAVAR